MTSKPSSPEFLVRTAFTRHSVMSRPRSETASMSSVKSLSPYRGSLRPSESKMSRSAMNEERPEAADVSTEMPSLEQLREVPRKNTPPLLGVVVGRFWSYFLSGCGAVLGGQVTHAGSRVTGSPELEIRLQEAAIS